jgi:DNA invertase Pin-like site-specific DNA recombinase
MTTAVLYCRESGEGDADLLLNLAEQEAMLIEDAKRRNYEYVVVKEVDALESAHARDRLADALDLLDEHHADILMAVRLDRLSAGRRDPSSVVAHAAARGWGLIIAGEPLGPGPVSARFQEHLDELAASRWRSQRTRAGLRRRKADGAPLGRVVNTDFLPTYRRVLGMSADGLGLNEIARRLNQEGVATARGGSWHASTVRAILASDTARKLA